MSSPESPRLDALEIRIAHQDRVIAELNDTVTAQWRKIDALERELKMLREEVRNAYPARNEPEPPPHY
jgi:SlyX protein